jgi:hypothetical protein
MLMSSLLLFSDAHQLKLTSIGQFAFGTLRLSFLSGKEESLSAQWRVLSNLDNLARWALDIDIK